jgi:predicted protein tyrosine phosphatase
MTGDDWIDVKPLVRFWRQSGCDTAATAQEFGVDEAGLDDALRDEVPVRRKLGQDGEWDEGSFAMERLHLGRIRRRLGLNEQDGG